MTIDAGFLDADVADFKHVERVQSLLRLATNRAESPESLLPAVVDEASVTLKSGVTFLARLFKIDGDWAYIQATASLGITTEAATDAERLPLAMTVASAVFDQQRAMAWNDISLFPQLPGFDRLREGGIVALIAAPFRAGGAQYVLTLASTMAMTAPFDAGDRNYIETVAAVLERITYERWQRERLRYGAERDALTGLYNRSRFRQLCRSKLDEQRGTEALSALLVIDISDFRRIVARVGDMIADALLVEVGASIARDAGTNEVTGRLGGDVFAVFISSLDSRSSIDARIGKLLALFDAPFSIGARTGRESIPLRANIGTALLPDNGADFDDALTFATTQLRDRKGNNEADRAELQHRLASFHYIQSLQQPPNDMLERVARLAATLFQTPVSLVTLLGEKTQWFVARCGVTQTETSRADAMCEETVRGNRVRVVVDTLTDQTLKTNKFVIGDPHVRFYAGAPLVSPEGVPIGTLCLLDMKPRTAFSEQQRHLLEELAAMAMAEIASQSTTVKYDAQTGLPNRTSLIEHVDALIDAPNSKRDVHVVVVIDLAERTRFDELVRILGRSYGDAFVMAAIGAVEAQLPPGTPLYHISRSTIAATFVNPSVESLAMLEAVARRLRGVIVAENIPLALNGSVGLATFPNDGSNCEELLRAGESATREAWHKNAGVAYFDPQIDSLQRRAFRLLTAIPRALTSAEQMSLHYQPQVDLRTGECVGFEALLRWRHEELGPIPPDELIALAERTGLISAITEWVLDEACAQLARWKAIGIQTRLSVNMSIVDLEDATFTTRIADRLRRFALIADDLELEVTETAGSTRWEHVYAQIGALRDMGLAIAIDDCGTGQSALGYLKSIRANVVKIDKGFVLDVDTSAADQHIVRSILQLTNAFNVRAVAEGVERPEIARWLLENGCTIGQGYLYARPLSASDAEAWYVQQRA